MSPWSGGQAWSDLSSRHTAIVLLSVDEAPTLAHSLPAALAQEGADEVVVVDNASGDDTAEVAQRHGARYLRLPRRVSYAAAVNQALGQVDSDAVLLLNADCFLRAGCLAAMLPRLAEPRVASVAPKLIRAELAADGAPRPIADQLDAAGMFVDRRRKNGLVGHGRPPRTFDQPGEAFGADGAAALYRREALQDCALRGYELLDEDMELWASDADLAWRARLLGWRCLYEPRAEALHVRTYSPSTRAHMSQQARRLQFRNRLLMLAKNETRAGLLRDGPRIVAYEVLALGYALLREPYLLQGYRDAWRLLPRARRRRRLIQGRRRVALPPFGLTPPA